jgi:hypothetical protein
MPGKEDDIKMFGEPNSTLRVVHAPSAGSELTKLRKAFQDANAEEGITLIGDFNVDFLTSDGLNALKDVLDKFGLTFDVSDETLAKMDIRFKMRGGLQKNPQTGKQDEPIICLKDLIFNLRRKTSVDEPTLPANFLKRINQLKPIHDALILEVKELEDANEKNVNAVVNRVALIHPELVSYHNLEKSHGNDHPSVVQTKLDEDGTYHITYAVNSPQYEEVDLTKHYNEYALNNISEEERARRYEALSELIDRETYKLYVIRDQNSQEKQELLTDLPEIRAYIRPRLQKSTELGSLSYDDKKEYCEEKLIGHVELFYRTIYNSKAFRGVHCLLRTSLLEPLTTEQGYEIANDTNIYENQAYQAAIQENIEKNKAIIKKGGLKDRLDKLPNSIGQKLLIGVVDKKSQSLSEILGGFAPYTKENGAPYTNKEVTDIQIEHSKQEVSELYNQALADPRVKKIKVTVALIEAGKQSQKIKYFQELADEVNILGQDKIPLKTSPRPVLGEHKEEASTVHLPEKKLAAQPENEVKVKQASQLGNEAQGRASQQGKFSNSKPSNILDQAFTLFIKSV